MTLAVIGSGFGRTGTRSLKDALEQLGFGPCHHMEEIFANPPQVAYRQAVVRGESINWNEVFDGYRAQMIGPGPMSGANWPRPFPRQRSCTACAPTICGGEAFRGPSGNS